mgnify:CR=1 FL=1
MSGGPLCEYRKRVIANNLRPDHHQLMVVEKLESLQVALTTNKLKRVIKSSKIYVSSGYWPPVNPRGIYIYGGVGRGKSMLMDLFFRTTSLKKKRRVHFHNFMQETHSDLNEYRKNTKHKVDLIHVVAKQIAKNTSLLCFDEFQVHDISDAMILGRLFQKLFEEGVVVVLTSNRPPSELYKDGLQRALFLPFIDLINDRLDLLMLDNSIDYRRQTIKQAGVYLMPGNEQAFINLKQLFDRLTNGANDLSDPIKINGREIKLPFSADGVAMCGFNDLCGEALGPADYIAIADRFHTLIVHTIPQLGAENKDKAKRFVTLIDALYENSVNFICSADAPPSELYIDGEGAFEFERTVSRLIEMQSEDYLGAARATCHSA